MNHDQTKFTTEELNIRLECLKIASTQVEDDSEICFLARNLYYWLMTDNDPECFYDKVEDPKLSE